MANEGLPEHCPPGSARKKPGTYYRLAESRHKVGEQAERGSWRKPYRTAGPMKGRTDVCEAHALSVMSDRADAAQFRRLSPWAAAKSLAQVEVSADDGVLLATPKEDCRSHHDWWTKPVDLIPTNNIVIEGPV